MANLALDGARRGSPSGTQRAHARSWEVQTKREGQGGRAADLGPSQHRFIMHAEFRAPVLREIRGPKKPSGKESLSVGKMRMPWERVDFPRSRAIAPGQAFVPSEHLVALYKRGIMAAVELARGSADFTETTLDELKRHELKSSEELALLLQEELLQFFALSASRGRVRNLKEIKVTEGGSFTLIFEHAISSNFLVRPADLGRFLAFLAEELHFHIVREGAFGGHWGRMVLSGGDLLLLLEGDRAPTYASKEKARVLRDEG
jgi:hypothetical protein